MEPDIKDGGLCSVDKELQGIIIIIIIIIKLAFHMFRVYTRTRRVIVGLG